MNSQIWDKAISFKQQLVTAVLWFTPLTINVVAFKAPHFLANLPGWGEEQQAPRLKIMAVARQLYIYIYMCVFIYIFIYLFFFLLFIIYIYVYIYTQLLFLQQAGNARSEGWTCTQVEAPSVCVPEHLASTKYIPDICVHSEQSLSLYIDAQLPM